MNFQSLMGFGGMRLLPGFWGMQFQNNKTIQEELDKPNPSLRVILNEEDLVKEIKNGSNEKLNRFLASNIDQLLDFLIEMPESDEHERGHKLPFQANDVLNTDCAAILDAFFTMPEPVAVPVDKTVESELPKQPASSEDSDEEQPHFDEEDDSGPLVVKHEEADQDESDEPNKPDQDESEESKADEDDSEEKPEADLEDNKQADEGKQEESPLDIIEKMLKDEVQETEEETSKKVQESKKEEEQGLSQTVEWNEEDVVPGDPLDLELKERASLEEEKQLPSLQTQDSTTCETRERSKYDYLDKLFSFLTTRPTEEDGGELNPVLCGYFSKLVSTLVLRRPKEFFLYISERPMALHQMARHLYSRGISDTLSQILMNESHGLEDTSTFGDFNELRTAVLEDVLLALNPENAPWLLTNAASVIINILARPHFFEAMTTPHFLKLLFNALLGTDTPSPADVRSNAVRILTALLAQYKQKLSSADKKAAEEEEPKTSHSTDDDDDVIIGADDSPKKAAAPSTPTTEISEDQPPEIQEPTPFIEAIHENFPKLVALLDEEPENGIDSITGQQVARFGRSRLSIVEIIGDIVKLNDIGLSSRIVDSNILRKLVLLFGKHEWNNLLHFKLDLIFTEILRNFEQCPELLRSLFLDAHFLVCVTQLVRSDDFVLTNSTARRIERGFQPYMVRFIQNIENLRQKSSFVDDQVKAFGEQEWLELWGERIEPKQRKYAVQLGGHHPMHRNKFQSDEPAISSNFSSYSSKEDQKKEEEDDDILDEIINDNQPQGDDDDDEDQGDTDLFGGRRNLLKGIDSSSQKHRNLYVQTRDAEEEEEDEEEEEETFQAWNVEDPESELVEEQEHHHQNRSSAIFEDEVADEEKAVEKEEEDAEFNDVNFWRVDSGYDLTALMQDHL